MGPNQVLGSPNLPGYPYLPDTSKYMYVCVQACMYAWMYVCVHVRMYACMYVCVHVCIRSFIAGAPNACTATLYKMKYCGTRTHIHAHAVESPEKTTASICVLVTYHCTSVKTGIPKIERDPPDTQWL